jgi:hypothetical protein
LNEAVELLEQALQRAKMYTKQEEW